jgi:uncharacterized protein with PhoU and TrkA domain
MKTKTSQFSKTITLDYYEFDMLRKVLSYVVICHGKKMTAEEIETINNVVDKLSSRPHYQNN